MSKTPLLEISGIARCETITSMFSVSEGAKPPLTTEMIAVFSVVIIVLQMFSVHSSRKLVSSPVPVNSTGLLPTWLLPGVYKV